LNELLVQSTLILEELIGSAAASARNGTLLKAVLFEVA
jgi:hypothetical protein